MGGLLSAVGRGQNDKRAIAKATALQGYPLGGGYNSGIWVIPSSDIEEPTADKFGGLKMSDYDRRDRAGG
jgi:hypothetical protein